MSSHEQTAWKAYFCEWDPLRYPGGLFAFLTVVATMALLHNGTALSVLVLLSSLPIQVYAARRLIFTFALFMVTFAWHLTYWLVTVKREGVLPDERAIVIVNGVFTLASLAASAYNPHQYGSRTSPAQFRIESESAHCAIPVFSLAHGQSDGAEPLSSQ